MRSSILEIVADQNLRERVIGTIKIMGIETVPNFDVLESALRSRLAGVSASEHKKRNLESPIHRLERIVNKIKNQWATKWYSEQLKEA